MLPLLLCTMVSTKAPLSLSSFHSVCLQRMSVFKQIAIFILRKNEHPHALSYMRVLKLDLVAIIDFLYHEM